MKTLLLIPALLLIGCAAKNTTTGTPAVPDPPQVTVLKLASVATAAGDTAAHELVALCNSQPAQLDNATCNRVKTALLSIKSFVDAATVEANKVPSAETWATARINIATLGAMAVLNAATGNTQLDAAIAALAALVKQIEGVQ